ncbi:MAG TPA: metallopeptidase family protein [Myxococcaceae bacterium]|nr:metallopeptidase family protein [Myxococcaceae bacterium]
MARRLALVCLLCVASACHRVTPADAPAKSAATNPGLPTAPSHHPSRPPPVEPLAVCDARGLDPLDAARAAYDAREYERALSCAAEASAKAPDEPDAHSERGAALSALGRFDEAKLAYARALALDPEHLDSLLGAAHLYGVSLPSSRDNDELAFVYAERGRQLAREGGDGELAAQFALLGAMAANDLGEAQVALERSEEAAEERGSDADVAYERAVALFELCRFKDAQEAFTRLLSDDEHGAHAHQHLGLLLEREGRLAEAEAQFRKAHELSPDDFPPPQLLSEKDFRREVDRAVAALPADMRKDLGGVPVTVEDIPKSEDLLEGDPPLSPTILGLFRGPPIGEPCSAEDGPVCRSVVVYRKNLARAVTSREELLEQVRVTLLHEIGHLRGEDDLELAARGLE